MLTLYHAPNSRSSRIVWLLEELGADYELKYVDIQRRDGEGMADPLNPHPAVSFCRQLSFDRITRPRRANSFPNGRRASGRSAYLFPLYS